MKWKGFQKKEYFRKLLTDPFIYKLATWKRNIYMRLLIRNPLSISVIRWLNKPTAFKLLKIQNYMLGIWLHAIQLSTTFITSRKFVYLLQCSAVDIQTHSFTIQTVPASLPAVGQYHPRLTHLWLFFCR